jgi:hypothetical protein
MALSLPQALVLTRTQDGRLRLWRVEDDTTKAGTL